MTTQIVVDYPESLPDVLRQTQSDFEHDAKMAMAAKLFELGRLPSGMAAQLVGVSRVSFLLGLHRFRVAMVDLDEAELAADVENA